MFLSGCIFYIRHILHNENRRTSGRKDAEELINVVTDAKQNDRANQTSFRPPDPSGVFLTNSVHITPLGDCQLGNIINTKTDNQPFVELMVLQI